MPPTAWNARQDGGLSSEASAQREHQRSENTSAASADLAPECRPTDQAGRFSQILLTICMPVTACQRNRVKTPMFRPT